MKPGDLVTACYRGDSGVVYRVEAVAAEVCDIVPELTATGEAVTKRHGYKRRRLHTHWLRAWRAP